MNTENVMNGTREVTKKVIIDGKIFIRDTHGDYVADTTCKPKQIKSPGDALPWLTTLQKQEQELFAVLLLDGGNNVISVIEVTKGLVNESQVHPREVFKEAIRHNAVSIILAHNHPSGTMVVSESDLKTTARLIEAGKILGIPVMDHLLIGNSHVSMREQYPDYF